MIIFQRDTGINMTVERLIKRIEKLKELPEDRRIIVDVVNSSDIKSYVPLEEVHDETYDGKWVNLESI